MTKRETFTEKKDYTCLLIHLVKERPILYDTEIKGKQNKEQAWHEIADLLGDEDINDTKKHWKNVRDRYVKVRNARKKHFDSGGFDINAPTYKFYEELDFMKDYSHKKDSEFTTLEVFSSPKELEPDSLVCAVAKEEDNEEIEYLDYSLNFLEELKNHPILYDSSLNDKTVKMKYRRSKAWTDIENKLHNKFSKTTLKNYFECILKKFKLFKSHHEHSQDLQDNKIFKNMEFLTQFIIKDEFCNETDYDSNPNIEFIPDYQEIDDSFPDYSNDTNAKEERVPVTGRMEFVINDDEGVSPLVDSQSQSYESDERPSNKKIKLSEQPEEDEFDFFGRKVAWQLRSIAQKSKRVAREVEIKCLELLMNAEEKLDAKKSNELNDSKNFYLYSKKY